MHLSIKAPKSAIELHEGDSVNVNGACQTVIAMKDDVFTVESVEETLRKTALGSLQRGSSVNLELAVRLVDRLGGHLVQGHVDCVGNVTQVVKQSSSWLITVEFPKEFSKYVIPVGSITLDGISLTVASTEGNSLVVSIIPHTLANTTLADVKKGSVVNIEFDLVGKYIEKLLTEGGKPVGLTAEKLASWGF